MIPDNVEKIIMTKEDYDRNVERLLLKKINAEQEIERLRDKILKLETDASIYKDLSDLRQERINKAIEFINTHPMYSNTYKEYYDELLSILQGDDKE